MPTITITSPRISRPINNFIFRLLMLIRDNKGEIIIAPVQMIVK